MEPPDSGTDRPEDNPPSPPRRGFFKSARLWEIIIVAAILAVIAAIAIRNRLRANMAANESAAIAAMRTYAGAQNIFHRTDYDGDTILEYCTPDNTESPDFTYLNGTEVDGVPIELIDDAFANAKLGAPGAKPKAGYYFIDISHDVTGAQYRAPFSYGLCAIPAEYGKTGINTFIIDVQGTVFQFDNGGKAFTEFPDTVTDEWIHERCE